MRILLLYTKLFEGPIAEFFIPNEQAHRIIFFVRHPEKGRPNTKIPAKLNLYSQILV